jgi:hypothetical protein
MKRTRRSIFSTPLLTATSGLLISMTGCGPTHTGNLLPPPPSVELCITPDPKEAKVKVNAIDLPESACTRVFAGEVADITATASDYLPYEEKLQVDVNTQHPIKLTRQ